MTTYHCFYLYFIFPSSCSSITQHIGPMFRFSTKLTSNFSLGWLLLLRLSCSPLRSTCFQSTLQLWHMVLFKWAQTKGPKANNHVIGYFFDSTENMDHFELLLMHTMCWVKTVIYTVNTLLPWCQATDGVVVHLSDFIQGSVGSIPTQVVWKWVRMFVSLYICPRDWWPVQGLARLSHKIRDWLQWMDRPFMPCQTEIVFYLSIFLKL